MELKAGKEMFAPRITKNLKKEKQLPMKITFPHELSVYSFLFL